MFLLARNGAGFAATVGLSSVIMSGLWKRFKQWLPFSSRVGDQVRLVVPNHGPKPDTTTQAKSPNRAYKNNHIKTTKYTYWNFVPKNLYEQFHRWANLYFIGIVCINFIPVINAFAKEVAVLPVVAVMGLTMLKDGYEDWKRLVQDRAINKTKCDVFDT